MGSVLCGHGPQYTAIFPGGRNIHQVLGMPSYNVWRLCKTEQILCHYKRHWHWGQPDQWLRNRLSENSRQHQNKINKQEAQINSLQNHDTQLKGLLGTKLLVDAISQAVTTSLKINSQPMGKGGAGANGTGYVSKPYLGKPQPSQLAPGADASLNLDLEFKYCKENCIKLNCQLAPEQRKIDPNSTAPSTYTSKQAN